MKRGKDACDTPRLNARRFEELVVETWVRGNRHEKLRYSWAVGLEATEGDSAEASR